MAALTPRIVTELLAHEGLVPEAYRDSVGVWTWSVGITDASGHHVFPRYKDRPQTLDHCLAVFLWVLRERYLPAVLRAFGSHVPSEAQLGAALSFHYNTGGIARADWLRRFLAGDEPGARKAFLNWCRPTAIVPRRRRERDLFFDQTWSADGTVMLYDVAKPSYHPTRGRRIAVGETIARLLAGEEEEVPEPAVVEQPAPTLPCMSMACPQRRTTKRATGSNGCFSNRRSSLFAMQMERGTACLQAEVEGQALAYSPLPRHLGLDPGSRF